MSDLFDLSNFDKYKEDNCREVKKGRRWIAYSIMGVVFLIFMYQELNVIRSLFILITIYLVAAIVEIGKATIIAQRQKLKVCSVMLRMRQRI